MLKAIRKRLNKKGFTLVELIVVIAVLGILATLAVPRITGIRENAEDTVIEANEKMLRNAAIMYLAENGNPDADETWDGSENQNWEDYIDEWPDNFDDDTDFEVLIEDDGTITITQEE